MSMALTGFFYTFTRPRTALPMGMLKYDPIGMAYISALELSSLAPAQSLSGGSMPRVAISR